MAIVGTIANTIVGAPVGVLTDPQQPNDGAAGGGDSSWVGDVSTIVAAQDQETPLAIVSDEMGSTIGMTMKPDGTKLYVSSFTADLIGEFDLSPAFDLTTAAHLQSYAPAGGDPSGVRFSADGDVMWWSNWVTEAIHAAPLSVAWDVSSAGTVVTKTLAGRGGDIQDFHWNADGTILFVMDATGSSIFQYAASSAYDISTLGAITATLTDATHITGGLGGLWVNGAQVFVLTLAYKFEEFLMTDENDISTAAWVQSRTTTSAGANPQGLYMDADAVYYTDISGSQRVHKNLWTT